MPYHAYSYSYTILIHYTLPPYTLIPAGPRADVIHAVWTAADVAARLIKAGGKNSAVTEAIKKVGQCVRCVFIYAIVVVITTVKYRVCVICYVCILYNIVVRVCYGYNTV